MRNEETGPDTETRDANSPAQQGRDAGLEKIAAWSTQLVIVSPISPDARNEATQAKPS